MTDAPAPERRRHGVESHAGLFFVHEEIEDDSSPPQGLEGAFVVFEVGGMKRQISWTLLESAAGGIALLNESQQAALEEMNPSEVAAAFSSVLPAKPANVVNDRLGPFYESDALARRWGISAAAVHKRVTAGHLLRIVSKNRSYYPSFQLDETGGMLPGLAEVQSALSPALTSPVSIAGWLKTPQRDLAGRTPVEVLRAGDTARVVRAARRLNERLHV